MLRILRENDYTQSDWATKTINLLENGSEEVYTFFLEGSSYEFSVRYERGVFANASLKSIDGESENLEIDKDLASYIEDSYGIWERNHRKF